METSLLLLTLGLLQLSALPGSLCKKVCSPGWVLYKDMCYYASTDKVKYYEVSDRCRSLNGRTAKINNLQTELFLDHYLAHLTWKIESNRRRGTLESSTDNVGLMFDVTEVQTFCFYMKGQTKRLSHVCLKPNRYLCEAEPVEDGTTTENTSNPCHEGLGMHQESCYWLVNTSLTRDASEEACEENGGHLVDINNWLEESYVSKVILRWPGSYWLGLRRHGDHLMWHDQRTLDLSTPLWVSGQPAVGSGDCTVAFFEAGEREVKQTVQWTMAPCNDAKYYGLCEREFTSTSITLSSSTPGNSESCPPEWLDAGDNETACYWLSPTDDMRSWEEARSSCRVIGGDLLIFKDAQEEQLKDLLVPVFNLFWIGLRNNYENMTLKDSTGYTLPTNVFSSMISNYPLPSPYYGGNVSTADDGMSKDCVAIARVVWILTDCSSKLNYICKAAKGEAVSPDVMNTTKLAASCEGIGADWEFHNDHCYKYVREKHTWHRAEVYCEDNGGYLITVTSESENEFLSKLVTGNKGRVWIGMNALGLDGAFRWVDGSVLKYANWAHKEPNNVYNQEKCGNTYSNGVWNDENCNTKLTFVCERPLLRSSNVLPAPSTTPLPGNCPSGWYPLGNKCFTVMGKEDKDKAGWKDALKMCTSVGHSLASIHTLEEQNFLTTLLMDGRITAWIGLHDLIHNSEFYWTDNSEVDFTNWAPNEPQNFLKKEDCVELIMHSENRIGKWNDILCDIKRAYICQMYKDPTILTPGPDFNACPQPEGWKRLASTCYELFSDPTQANTWYGAELACRRYGGHLLTVQNAEVSQNLMFQFAVDVPVWIGLKENKNNRFEWSSKWPVLYTNWKKGQPSNRLRGTRCAVMSNFNQWDTSNCRTGRPFICEVSTDVPPTMPNWVEGSCPQYVKGWNDLGGEFCYYLESKKPATWSIANKQCSQKGGTLASIHSRHEVSMLALFLKQSKTSVWIGLARKQDGGFGWSDGSPLNYAKWAPNEPSTLSERCVQMFWDSTDWNDLPCSRRLGYICMARKVIPNGTTFAMQTLEKTPNGHQLGLSAGGVVGVVVSCIVVIGLAAAIFLRRREKDFSLLPNFRPEPMSFVNTLFSRDHNEEMEVAEGGHENEELTIG